MRRSSLYFEEVRFDINQSGFFLRKRAPPRPAASREAGEYSQGPCRVKRLKAGSRHLAPARTAYLPLWEYRSLRRRIFRGDRSRADFRQNPSDYSGALVRRGWKLPADLL